MMAVLPLAHLIRPAMPRHQQKTARKPATKFAHLRKKMEKARVASKPGKKPKPGRSSPARKTAMG
jgi:hypothetical protein